MSEKQIILMLILGLIIVISDFLLIRELMKKNSLGKTEKVGIVSKNVEYTKNFKIIKIIGLSALSGLSMLGLIFLFIIPIK